MITYILSLFLFFFNPNFSQKGRLIVSVSNLENNEGSVFVALFNSADGFPSEGKKALKTSRVIIKNKTATVIFDDLPFGYYATTTYHDENGNNKIETIFGIPKEGVGASNMRTILLGAPKFERSKFNHQAKETKINLTIIYDIFKLI